MPGNIDAIEEKEKFNQWVDGAGRLSHAICRMAGGEQSQGAAHHFAKARQWPLVYSWIGGAIFTCIPLFFKRGRREQINHFRSA